MQATIERHAQTEHLDDNELRKRLLAGEQAAGTELFARHRQAVYRAARSVIRDADLAEDVVQEVFVEFFRHPEQVDLSLTSLRGFLMMVARRRSIDAVRSLTSSRRREAISLANHRSVAAPLETGARLLAATDQRSVRAAILRLPAPQRAAIAQAFYGDRTYRQTASTLGIPEGTAKSRIRRP